MKLNNSKRIASLVVFIGVVFTMPGCAVIAPVASEAIGGKVIDIVGSFNDKQLIIPDHVKNNKNFTIEKEKWRQIVNNEISLVFVVQSAKACTLGIFAKGSVYKGDYVIDNWLFQRVGGTVANAKYVANERVYLIREKGFASKVTLDSVECM